MFNGIFHTMLLSKLFGVYLVILAIVMLGQARYYRALLVDFTQHRHLIFMCATSSLLLGIFLVLIHNFWNMHPRVLLTLFAWWILIKSALWLGAPDTMSRLVGKMYDGSGYYIAAALVLIYGVLLMSVGFYFESGLFNQVPFAQQ